MSPCAGLHDELELLVEAGHPPLEVATRNGAESPIERGKRADLVIPRSTSAPAGRSRW